MDNKKRLAATIMAVLSILVLAVGSLAFFTDRFQSDVNLTAGTLDLELEQAWVSDNAAISSNFRPGTGLKLQYTLVNGGNVAASVREKFVISFDKALTAAAPEFSVYNAADVTVAADGTVTLKSGAAPIPGVAGQYSASGKTWYKLTYEIPQFALNGSVEKISGISSQEKSASFVLVFNTNASNAFQGVSIKIEYLAQGLQYSNSGEDTWNDANVVKQTITFGGASENVVPELVVPEP